jgi:hypothetical protein
MNTRLGFHYFEDQDHYQAKDLDLWLQELISLNANWLLLKASTNQAIPEEFITKLVDSGIQPIIHFDFPVNSEVRPEELRVLLSAYSRWGVKYVIFFNRPNTKAAWLGETWAQGDIVSRFLNRYLSFTRLAEQFELTPIFPALAPSGEYWDISFLKSLLNLVKQRHVRDFADQFILAVSAQSFGHSLTYGHGGPGKWKMTLPYSKPELGEEDHIGFNTWSWYASLVQQILGIQPKLVLFWMGTSNVSKEELDPRLSFETLTKIMEDQASETLPALSADVLACMCAQLGAKSDEALGKTAWFDTQGRPNDPTIATYQKQLQKTQQQSLETPLASKLADWLYAIDHYLLLPSFEWGIPENLFDQIRPFVRTHRPTMGFSVTEASNARKVTVWNEDAAFSEEDIQFLRESGCIVEELILHTLRMSVEQDF